MADFCKSLKILVHTAAFILLVGQMFLAVKKYCDKATMISPSSKTFESLNKTLIFTICKTNQFNKSILMDYNDESHYYPGMTADGSKLTWTYNSLTINETQRKLFNTNIMEEFNFTQAAPLKVTEKFLLPHGFCKVFEGKPMRHMVGVLNKVQAETEYIMFVSDSDVTNPFQMAFSLMSGDQLEMKNSPNRSRFYTYTIHLKETVVDPRHGNCVNYPNGNHVSYSACVEAEMRERIVPVLGCMFPWMSSQDACTGDLPRLAKHQPLIDWTINLIYDAWGGIEHKSESCLVPCNLLHFQTEYHGSGPAGPGGQGKFFIHFGMDINVEKELLAYDETDLLVEIGSCLGLWLGLSVIGMVLY